jgi:HK97 family phage portal protein
MGILSQNLGIRALSLEDPAQPLLPYSALFESLGLGRSDAGVMVNEKQAMRLSTAYGCINIISSDLSRLPFEIFQEMPDGSMRLAKEHRCFSLLRDRPNPTMSSMAWRRAMLASALAYGNGYSWIKRDKAARVVSLHPLASDKTSPVFVNGEFGFATTQTPTGEPTFIDPQHILHLPALSLDGVTGLSPIRTCMNAFGLGLAAEKFGAQFFGNGARSTGVLSHPGVLEPEAYENLKKSVREWATGDTALRPIILEEGLKWEQISIPPNEAQFIETRKLQKEEVACIYRTPMHLLQDLQRATNNNIEHQGLDYVRFCLAPWAVLFEQEINYKLLGGAFIAEFNFRDLERGSFATQTAGYQVLRNIGVFSANDILRGLRMNPIPAEEGGDVRTVQGAMIPLSSMLLMEENPETVQTDTENGDPAAGFRGNRIAAAYRPLFRDAIGRAINRSGDEEFARRAFQPAVSSMAQALIASRFGNCELTKRELDLISSQVTTLASAASSWQRSDASAIATRLTGQVYEALAKEILG